MKLKTHIAIPGIPPQPASACLRTAFSVYNVENPCDSPTGTVALSRTNGAVVNNSTSNVEVEFDDCAGHGKVDFSRKKTGLPGMTKTEMTLMMIAVFVLASLQPQRARASTLEVGTCVINRSHRMRRRILPPFGPRALKALCLQGIKDPVDSGLFSEETLSARHKETL